MVIDAHEHVVQRPGFADPRWGESFITAAQLVALMDRAGIDKAVVLPCVPAEALLTPQTNEEAYAAADQFPGRFIKFCCADPRQGNNLNMDFVPLLEYYKSLGAVGFGEFTANLWWYDPRVQNILVACEEVGFPFVFHVATRDYNTYGVITQPGLIELEQALKSYPRLQFLGHSQAFWAEVGPHPSTTEREGYPKGPVKPGGRVPELMRRYPSLWGDLSAGSGHNAVSRDPAWGYSFLEEFQDRLLMGLDVCWASHNTWPLIDFLRDARDRGAISSTVFDKVMGGNAARLLSLD